MKEDITSELVEMMFKLLRLMKHEMSFTNKNNLTHLSILQIQALMFLGHNKNVTMSDLAGYFRIELPSATSLINKLCEQKLVHRYEDQEDRRLVKIELTKEGKTLLDQAMCQRRDKVEKILSYLSVKEKSQLLTIIKTLHSKLHK